VLPAFGGGQVFGLQVIPLPGGELVTALIICLAAFNLIRMILYLAGAHVYMIKRASSKDRAYLWRRGAGHRIAYQPTVSLVSYCQDLWMRLFQATSVSVDLCGSVGVMSMGRSSSLPLWNTAPARTRATRCGALTARQRVCAASISL
jgi:hypothetical protein